MKSILFAAGTILVAAMACMADIGGAAVDPDERALNVMDAAHYRLHQGDAYYVGGSTVLANGAICEFLVQVGASVEPNMVFEYGSTAAFTFIGYESSTWTATGATAVVPKNSDRNSTNASSVTVYRSNGTGGTAGTVIDGPFSYGASGSPIERSGGGSSRVDEIILKKGTKYLFRFTNGSSANTINYRATWYEVEE